MTAQAPLKLSSAASAMGSGVLALCIVPQLFCTLHIMDVPLDVPGSILLLADLLALALLLRVLGSTNYAAPWACRAAHLGMTLLLLLRRSTPRSSRATKLQPAATGKQLSSSPATGANAHRAPGCQLSGYGEAQRSHVRMTAAMGPSLSPALAACFERWLMCEVLGALAAVGAAVVCLHAETMGTEEQAAGAAAAGFMFLVVCQGGHVTGQWYLQPGQLSIDLVLSGSCRGSCAGKRPAGGEPTVAGQGKGDAAWAVAADLQERLQGCNLFAQRQVGCRSVEQEQVNCRPAPAPKPHKGPAGICSS